MKSRRERAEPGRTQDGGVPSSKTGQIEDGKAKNGVPSSKTARNEDGKGAAAETGGGERRRKTPRSPATAGACRMAQNQFFLRIFVTQR